MNKRQARQIAYELITGIIHGALAAGCAVEEHSDADSERVQAAMEKVAEEMKRRSERLLEGG